ncbi:hypothetical protein ACFC8N_40415 [Streptomyces sp. NPDC055966]|uniref:hypothetical protein n=1 Tax=unclassified Streptomyces TaxID=2593676 RepID=UPI001DD8E9AC|nr:ABC transporter permease [Streptomyces sp. tea 10]
MTGVRVAWNSFLLQLRGTSWLSILIAAAVQPAAYVSITLAADRPGGVAPQAVVLGSGLLAVWTITLWQAGMVLRRELWSGTLPSICSRPGGLGPVLVGKSVASVALSASMTAISIVATSALEGHPLAVERPALFAAALAAALVSTLPLGLLVSCLFLLTRSAIRIAETLVYPVVLMGGLLVPLSMLPPVLRPPADALSLHWAYVLLAGAMTGPVDGAAWAGLLTTGLCYTVAARLAFIRVLHRARREGTLEIF